MPLYTDADDQRECEDGSTVDPWRSAFRRDYARVLHSPSWRRLQGKTQLFPGHESDFFRNRLTHSLEVSQIAEGIAERLNHIDPYLQNNKLSPRLCAAAGLMHDLGHPPFGHNGEHALDKMMREYGGFEGNAQTLRIITRLEKKVYFPQTNGSQSPDQRAGLNLSFRSIASALKYDSPIPPVRAADASLSKGYYADATDLIDRVKDAVEPKWRNRDVSFKTIECSIMDIADDIAYSTYDLEDSLQAGFLTPGSILASDDELLDRVAKKVGKSVELIISREEVLAVLMGVFSGVLGTNAGAGAEANDAADNFIQAYRASEELARDGHTRTALTAQLVSEMIKAVSVEIDHEYPSLSKVSLSPDALLQVEVLKNYTYEATIFSTRLKVAEYRGHDLVRGIFEALAGPKGDLLMPSDVRQLVKSDFLDKPARMRVICDFIAGMTDRYAIEFFGRLHSDSGQTIFKPV